MATSLTTSYLFKDSWKVEKFIEKYENREEFQLLNRKSVRLAFDEELLKVLKSKNQVDYRNLTFIDDSVGNRKYRFTDFLKNEEFGAVTNYYSGTDTVEKQLFEINSNLFLIKSETNIDDVSIRIYNRDYNVSSATRIDENKIALLNSSGEEVAWIFYKSGYSPTTFKKWIDMNVVSYQPEVQEFVNQVRSNTGNIMPRNTIFGKRIENNYLKNISIYGTDFTRPFRNLGRNNVSLVLQGNIKFRKSGKSYILTANHVRYNGDVEISEYEPIMIARFINDSDDFDIIGAKFEIVPRNSYSITDWLDE